MGHAYVVDVVPIWYPHFFNVSYVGQYNLAVSSTLVQSTASKECQDIEVHWNLLNMNVSYIISVLPFEDEENETEWNTTTRNGSVIIPRDQLAVGVTYEVELQVVVGDADPSSPMEVITRQLLNITLPACSKPKG